MAVAILPRDYYVYVHRRATDGSVFYVGKGKGRRATETRSRNRLWHNIVKKHGFTVEYVCTGMQEWWALEMERELIAFHGRDKTANMTDGGDGLTNPSGEVREKISLSGKGRKHSDHSRKLISEAGKGRVFSAEVRRKISEAQVGRKRDPEVVKKIAQKKSGKPLSEEHKRKLSEAKLGKKRPPEVARKISESKKGTVFSEQHRQRLSMAQKLRFSKTNS